MIIGRLREIGGYILTGVGAVVFVLLAVAMTIGYWRIGFESLWATLRFIADLFR